MHLDRELAVQIRERSSDLERVNAHSDLRNAWEYKLIIAACMQSSFEEQLPSLGLFTRIRNPIMMRNSRIKTKIAIIIN